tara:strand:+ start:4928 stop:5872 length:945 start_codon:yes stop_codon:yes gene_type:complete
MNSLLFPGQGSQVVGMGNELYSKYEIVKKIFRLADEKLNFSLSKIILEGPTDKLQLTENTQPSILTVSYSIFKILTDEFGYDLQSTQFFAGHSLGEYSALVCSGALDFSDAIYLLHERGKAMQDSVPVGNGSMIAVLGLSLEDLEKKLTEFKKNNDGVCEIANDNAEGQVILSGEKATVELFQLYLKKDKIKSIPLKVSAPFHCSLMKPAAAVMKIKINETEIKNPKFPIIYNVTANIKKESEDIKSLLIDQIVSTVKWRESIIYMSKAGVSNFIEVGPGKVLAGMVKRTIKNANCFSINSIADMQNLKNELKR